MSSRKNKKINWRDKKAILILIGLMIFLLISTIILATVILYIANNNNEDLSAAAAKSSFAFSENLAIQPLSTSTTPTPMPSKAPTISPTPTSTPTVSPTPSIAPSPTPAPTPIPEPTRAPTPTPKPKKKMPKLLSNPDGKKDEDGRLYQFKELLKENSHVKGWIKDSTMDYVVLQPPKSDPEYYLFKDFFGDYYKAGSLFLDHRSSVETPTQNFVIHGHNMISTPEKMFHYIKFYKDVSYYKKHPIISFDTIYEEADYKVFAIIKTTPKANEDYFFEYRQSTFEDASDFLNFAYQIRIRSLITVDDVDINENDTLLTLSTCSYEVDNDYRTVVFARKIRENEDKKVNMKTVKVNKNPLYCYDYYKQNGGKAPKLPATFEDALKKGKINWYRQP